MKLATIILFIVSAVAATGQTITGTLGGLTTDQSGAALPGVVVTAVEANTNRTHSAVTNSSGTYSIPNLAPGLYQLQFQIDNFKTAVRPDVEVRVNENTRSSVALEIGEVSERVTVQAESTLLQTDNSSVSATIRTEQLLRLPLNARQLENLILLLGGTVSSAPNSHLSNRGGFNIGGLDEHYISYFVDGIDNVDPVIRIASYRPSIDTIQEIKVDESGYRAESGRNGGGVINVTTRSGTNNLHFSFWEFLRNDNFDARNFFAPSGFSKPSMIRNQFGGTFGGALKQNRTFFFFAFEGIRQKTGQVHRATVPTARMRLGDLSEIGGPILVQPQIHPIAREVVNAYPLPNLPGVIGNRIEIANKIENGKDFSGRLDHELSSSTRLMGRFSRSVTHVLDPFRTETTGVSNLAGFGQTADRFRTNIGVTLTSTIGSNTVNEVRVGFNRFGQPQIPVNPGTPLQQPLMGTLKTFPVFNFVTSDTIGSNAEFRRAVNVYNYMDNLSYVRGNHQIKVGVDIRRYLFNAYNVGPNIFVFTGARTGTPTVPGNPMADFLLGLPTQTISFDGQPTGNTRKFEFAGYVQDDWKATPRLTFNYGLRWDYYGRITERVNKQSFWVPECNCIRIAGKDASEGLVDNDFNNFAPRFGFAWRPVGDRTVVRASAGVFYDNDMRHNLEFATNPPFFFVREFVFPPSLSDPFPASQASTTLRPNTIEKQFRDTYVEHWNFSVQHELLQGILAEAAYVGNHSVKARRLRNVNQSINGVSPYPGFGPISLFEQAGSSNYNALQLRIERPFYRNLGFTSTYTWGHAIDDRPGQGGGRVPNNYNMRSERADADFDVRHNWASSVSFNVPWGETKPWGRWSVNAVTIVQAGRPFTVTVPGGNNERPDVVPGIDWKPANQGPDHWVNPAAFAVLPQGLTGNLGRNTLRGPGLVNFDLSLVKTERIRDTRMELRAEFFNIFNHPNFNLPNAVVGPALGVISSTSTPERQIQFGVKVNY
jgi:outer membrane receptor protein involved in Fe transport